MICEHCGEDFSPTRQDRHSDINTCIANLQRQRDANKETADFMYKELAGYRNLSPSLDDLRAEESRAAYLRDRCGELLKERDEALKKLARSVEKDGPCYYCGGMTECYSSNPRKAPVFLCHRDEPGRMKPHHMACVNERLAGHDELAKKLSVLEAQHREAMEPKLAKNQPCGCVVCTCEGQIQCLGCGAKHCGNHPVGEIPNPVYRSHPLRSES